MPHRVAGPKMVMVAITGVVATDWVFRFVFAPLLFIAALLGCMWWEAWTDYRCCGEDDKFDFSKAGWKKLEILAQVGCAMGMDVVIGTLAKLAPEKFPLIDSVQIPVLTLGWAGWLIFVEARNTRRNVVKSRGKAYGVPFPDRMQRMVGELLNVDATPGEEPPPRRRKADRKLEEIAREVLPPTPPAPDGGAAPNPEETR